MSCARGELPIRGNDIIAVNLSGTSLNDDHFLDFIRERVRQLPTEVSRSICFEITETAAVASISRAQTFMKSVRAMGCKFALDDFGSGLSSFVYIKNLPVDFVKIEGSFVRAIVTDSVARAMVEAVCHIGRAIRATLIAEWVENDALLAQVKELGIDYAQGYAVSAPQPLRLLTPSEGSRSHRAARRLRASGSR
ncbi:MAG: EAL domain-containing protein [Betaproteobacteria bacterium]|nr:MAG: EAL domain-containing protein [Betaproteobacteria bacterium]